MGSSSLTFPGLAGWAGGGAVTLGGGAGALGGGADLLSSGGVSGLEKWAWPLAEGVGVWEVRALW